MDIETSPNIRSPLIWLVAPILVGYLVGFYQNEIDILSLVLPGTLFSGFSLILCQSSSNKFQRFWPLLFLTAGFLLAWSYYLIRSDSTNEWQDKPPREVILNLKVTRIFDSKKEIKTRTGIAIINETEKHTSDLIGKKIYFSLSEKNKPNSQTILQSSEIKIKGVIKSLDTNDDANKFYSYLKNNGVQFELNRIKILKFIDAGNLFFQFCNRQNAKIKKILELGKSESHAFSNIYIAMLLGKKTALAPQQKNDFLKSGTMHLFAISGLHVGVIAYTLFYILYLLRIPQKPAALIGLTLLFTYIEITGASASAVRAFIMVFVIWLGKVILRKNNTFSSLLFSALIVLIIDPGQLFNPGFQLSYTVVGSIILYGIPLQNYLLNKLTLFRGLPEISFQLKHYLSLWMLRNLITLFSICFTATLFSTPLLIIYFNILTPGAIVLNMVLISLASLLMVSGLISIILGYLKLTALSTFINHGAWVIIWLIEKLVEIFINIPGLFLDAIFKNSFFCPISLLLMICPVLLFHCRIFKSSIILFIAPPIFLVLIIFFGVTII